MIVQHNVLHWKGLLICLPNQQRLERMRGNIPNIQIGDELDLGENGMRIRDEILAFKRNPAKTLNPINMKKDDKVFLFHYSNEKVTLLFNQLKNKKIRSE